MTPLWFGALVAMEIGREGKTQQEIHMKNKMFAAMLLSLACLIVSVSAFADASAVSPPQQVGQPSLSELKQKVKQDRAKLRRDRREYGKQSDQVKEDRKVLHEDRERLHAAEG